MSGSLIRDTPPCGADVGRHPLERHDRDRAGVLGDLGLLGGDDVHDDAALEHLGHAALDAGGADACSARLAGLCSTDMAPILRARRSRGGRADHAAGWSGSRRPVRGRSATTTGVPVGGRAPPRRRPASSGMRVPSWSLNTVVRAATLGARPGAVDAVAVAEHRHLAVPDRWRELRRLAVARRCPAVVA